MQMQLHRPDPNYASACTFSPDGRTLYSSWTDQLLLFDTATGRELYAGNQSGQRDKTPFGNPVPC